MCAHTGTPYVLPYKLTHGKCLYVIYIINALCIWTYIRNTIYWDPKCAHTGTPYFSPYLCYVTHSNVVPDSFMFVTRRIPMYHVTHSNVWPDPFFRHSVSPLTRKLRERTVTTYLWRVHVCDLRHSMAQSYVWRAQSHVWYDSLRCVVGLPPVWDMR